MGQAIQLIGKKVTKTVDAEVGKSILDLAMQHDVDWGFSCTRGTCARCRCQIETGAAFLEPPTEAEWNRLDEEELEEGYRLGCQAIIREAGDMTVRNKTYF